MSEGDVLRRPAEKFDVPSYQTCFSYWERLKGDRKSPSWREWDWFELPLGLIPFFLVVDVQTDPVNFFYRFYGTASVTMHGKDYTGLSVFDLPTPRDVDGSLKQYTDVVNRHEAMTSEYRIEAGTSGLPIVQTSLRLPFSDDGENVAQIATFVDWTKDLKRIRQERVGEFCAAL